MALHSVHSIETFTHAILYVCALVQGHHPTISLSEDMITTSIDNLQKPACVGV